MPTNSSIARAVVAAAWLLLAAPVVAQDGDRWTALGTATNGRFSIFDSAGEASARTLLELAEDVHDDFTFLVDLPADTNLFGRRTADIYLLRSGFQYQMWVDTILPVYRADPRALDFYRDHPRAVNPEPPVSAAPESGLGARNWTVNSVAHLLLAHYLGPGKRAPAWLTEGFAAWAEMRFTGRTIFFRIEPGRYRDGGEGDDPVKAKRGQTAFWTGVLDPMVRAGSTRRFDRLKSLGINRLTFRDLCQSWSLVKFLAEERPRAFARWLALMRRTAHLERGGWERAFRRAFGWTDAQVHEQWTAWAKLDARARRLAAKKKRRR